MPTVPVERDLLFELLGETLEATSAASEEKFQRLCFLFGIELDEVTSEVEEKRKMQGADADVTGLSSAEMYKIDIPANRYDLLCIEGLVRALRVFLGREPAPVYQTVEPAGGGARRRLVVKPATAQIRPFVVGAILRNIDLSGAAYDSFIQLQTRLHFNICKKRELVAIGTHDLDTLAAGDITYDAQAPSAIRFQALNESKAMTAGELFAAYAARGKSQCAVLEYVPIIEASPVYPVIRDAAGTVLSVPPIINGEHSKLTPRTTNVFIECTATDQTKARVVINTLVCMFSEHCKTRFAVEPVDVVYEAAKRTESSPNLQSERFVVDVDTVNRNNGFAVSGAQMASLLQRMQLDARFLPAASQVEVFAPPTRSDIMHACDIEEDIAIAFGYGNIRKTVPKTATMASQVPLNKLTELVRQSVAECGYLEVLNWALLSREENYASMQLADDAQAVVIGRAAHAPLEIVRTHLLPSILKSLRYSNSLQLPLQLFEAGDVVQLDASAGTGASNKRRIAAVLASPQAEFEKVHGLVDRIMTCLGCQFVPSSDPKAAKLLAPLSDPSTQLPRYYTIRPNETSPSYFPGRCADLFLHDVKIGIFGVIHPDVLSNFKISDKALVSAMELELDPFVAHEQYP